MGQKTPITSSFNLPDGREVTIETGKLATQAHGSVVVRMGNTMLFAAVVSAHEANPDAGYFPLMVDYREKFAAAGRIPGNFFRRESRPSSYEILISRLIDRAIRPLFPDGYMNETIVTVELISGEEEVMPDALAALAASAALAVSDIPFAEPLSEVRVAKINGELVVNPLRSALETAEIDIIVAATMDNVMMVEGEAQECSEAELVGAIKVAHEAIKVQIQAQLDLAEKVGESATVKREVEPIVIDEELYADVERLAKDSIYKVAKGQLDKKTRKNQFKDAKTALKEALLEEKGEEYMDENGGKVSEYFEKLLKKVVRSMVLEEGVRLDGRAYDQVRPIWTEVNYLPSAHGSAIFQRGETQTLASLTLGTKRDQLMIDNALKQEEENFILHYNFPAYSVGEARGNRGPGRREVGHGNLAERALRPMLPTDTGYTIRLVSDVLESNGSSSMATVCSGTLALMDAGIKIKKPVSGIAMGMISEDGKAAVLTDILGDEDALGDMDFKVTGTTDGITACQMDIKIDGLPYEKLEEALMQARDGRLHILGEMAKTLEAPAEDLKPHAPRIVELTIDKKFIGAIIGPGGKIIQEMQAETGTVISIEEVDGKGIVNVAGTNKESLDAALERINKITFVPQVGDVYEGIVKTIMPYGVFVDFKGHSGLLHVSEISHSRIEKVEEHFSEGDTVKFKLLDIDPRSGKMKLSRKAIIPNPHGPGDDRRRDDRRRDDRRDDRKRDDRRRDDRRRDDRKDR